MNTAEIYIRIQLNTNRRFGRSRERNSLMASPAGGQPLIPAGQPLNTSAQPPTTTTNNPQPSNPTNEAMNYAKAVNPTSTTTAKQNRAATVEPIALRLSKSTN